MSGGVVGGKAGRRETQTHLAKHCGTSLATASAALKSCSNSVTKVQPNARERCRAHTFRVFAAFHSQRIHFSFAAPCARSKRSALRMNFISFARSLAVLASGARQFSLNRCRRVHVFRAVRVVQLARNRRRYGKMRDIMMSKPCQQPPVLIFKACFAKLLRVSTAASTLGVNLEQQDQ